MVLPFGLGSDGSSSRMTPSAPPIEIDQHNYSRYIDFIVVNGDDRYMIHTERKNILESSVELAKILNAGPTSGRKNDNHFIINNVDKLDFELMVRFLETKFIKYKDHIHILRILELADRYNCPDLMIHCVKELDLQLTSAIVLDIFRSLWYYNCISPAPLNILNNTNITTNPNQIKLKQHKKLVNHHHHSNKHPFTPEEYLSALLNNSLQLIDMHAELILTKTQMLQLRFEELETIVKRDTLQIQSEIVLFVCLADWSLEECKRKKLDLTAENRRRVLGPLCYMPKYLTMSTKEFQRTLDRVHLLDSYEIQLITDTMETNQQNNKKKQKVNLTNEQTTMLERFKAQRPQYAKMPIHLSDRSNPKNYTKKMRKFNSKADKHNDDSSCWDSFGLNCLAIFACIFD